jgi:ribonuclease J
MDMLCFGLSGISMAFIVISGPDIVSRGFVYVKESELLMKEAKKVVMDSLEKSVSRRNYDYQNIKNTIRDDLAKFIFKETKRKPMILPVIMDI